MKESNIFDENEEREDINIDIKPVKTYENLMETVKSTNCAFNVMSDDYRKYSAFLRFLDGIKYNLQEMKETNTATFSAEEQKKYKEAGDLYDEFSPYYTSLKALSETSQMNIEKEDFEEHLKNIQNFEAFLKAGKDKTNYQRLMEHASKKIATPELEFAKGYNLLEKNLHYGFKIDKVTKAVAKQEIKIQEPEISAIERIETMRVPVGSNKNAYKSGIKDPKDIIVRIMAARYIAESERGYSTKLSKTMTDTELSKTEAMLKDNPLFSDWLDKVLQNPNLRSKAVDAICTGHGGKLDDMFKKHLAGFGAGQLEIPSELDRYRPSALIRIEALQAKAETAISKGQSPSKELAEIIILRNAVRAERNVKDSLKTQIPKNYEDLKNDIEHLAADENFQTIINRTSVRENISKGHGGKMIDNIRLQYKLTDNSLKNLSVTDIIDEGTIGGRLSMLQRKAAELNKTVSAIADAEQNGADKHTAKEKSAYSDQAIELVAEYLALAIHRATIKDDNVDEMNIPWKKVNEIKRSCMQSLSFKTQMGLGGMLNRTTEKLTELTEINTTPNKFTVSFSEQLRGFVSESAMNKVANKSNQTSKQKTTKTEAAHTL